ncbi:MAG: hypothetical protein IJZ47_08680 [Oscillospiraceae bacterium]|nr:hypothetical protein [Oscillospiraceae bacterium]
MTPYEPNDLINYRATLALLKKLVTEGTLTEKEYRKICGILNKKYGFPSGSIFAENA